MEGLQRVFGLSIGEEIEWATALADVKNESIIEGIESGPLCAMPENNLPRSAEDHGFLEQRIGEGLVFLAKERRDLFEESVRIGISTIGVVDQSRRELISVALKNWMTRRDENGVRPPLIDFKRLFIPVTGPLFRHVRTANEIVVQNDVSARCMTEYIYGFEADKRPESLMYLVANEGVNAAFVLDGHLPSMVGNPEAGHATPRLHEDDARFNRMHSACRTHIHCYEGLASNGRAQKQWQKNLWELPDDHEAWDRFAYYLAQLAISGHLALNPSKIICGGSLFQGPKGLELIRKMRTEFLRLNAGYLPSIDSEVAVGALIERAAFDNRIVPLSALTMATLQSDPKSVQSIGDTAKAFDNVVRGVKFGSSERS